jgi:lipid-A-disaccharide synthase
MHIFICAGEPSGDLHGSNLIHALRARQAGFEFVGFGGERMRDAGCQLIYPLCQLAIMWFARVLANAHVFLDLISRADRHFRHRRPDAVVLIDYPGFNWWLARRARFHGIPVFFFVPPQLWAWAGWRVHKMRRFVDHVLCSLPFEKDWYENRGVRAHYVGHPYFDELSGQRFDESFLDEQGRERGRRVALLPGSRTQEVRHNWPTLLRSAGLICQEHPDTRFLVACFKDSQRQYIDHGLRGCSLPVESFVGKTPEIIHLADACIAVSGSVGLEMLFQQKPAVVTYRISPLARAISRPFIKSRFISLVNLLADEEVYPEFLSDRCEAKAISMAVSRWLREPADHDAVCRRLSDLCRRVAQPGACDRTAKYILEVLEGKGNPKPMAA